MRQTGWYQVMIVNPDRSYRNIPIPQFVWDRAWWDGHNWLVRPFHGCWYYGDYPSYFRNAVHDVRPMPTASGTTAVTPFQEAAR